jgi:hypothetical protein
MKFSDSTHFNPKAEDSTTFSKVDLRLKVYTVSQLRRLECEQSQPQKSQHLHDLFHFHTD